MAPHIYTITWSGIEIEIGYWPLKWNTISHVTIKSVLPAGAPLPITATGYLSHFFHPSAEPLTEFEIIAFVREWLHEAAQSKTWQQQAEAARQGRLF